MSDNGGLHSKAVAPELKYWMDIEDAFKDWPNMREEDVGQLYGYEVPGPNWEALSHFRTVKYEWPDAGRIKGWAKQNGLPVYDEMEMDRAGQDNRTKQCNPTHAPTGPGHDAGYKGSVTKADLDNRSTQMNPNNPKYQSPKK